MDIRGLMNRSGIVGHGISFIDHRCRIASTQWSGDRIRVLGLHEFNFSNSDFSGLQQALHSIPLPKKCPLALGLTDGELHMKQVEIPSLPAGEVAQALRWQLMEDMDGIDQEFEIRFNSLDIGQSAPERRHYLVFGIPRHVLERKRKWCRMAGLNVIAGEPLPVSLAAWYEALEPGSEKIVGLFYLNQRNGEFIGIDHRRLSSWKRFRLSEGIALEIDSELMVNLQQHVDRFLMENQLSHVDEILLAGDWGLGAEEKFHQSLGIPCRSMVGEPSRLEWIDPEVQNKASRFAAELGLSIYPKGEL